MLVSLLDLELYLFAFQTLSQVESQEIAFPIILLWLEGNIYTAVKYSILHGDNADIFTVSVLMSYCRFSILIVSSVVMITFYILSKKLRLKCKGLSDLLYSLAKKEYGFVVHFS